MNPIDGLYGAAPKFNPTEDPLGIALMQRTKAAAEERAAKIRENQVFNPWATMQLGQNYQSAQSQWAPWLQALSEAAGDKNLKMSAGSNATGSNQLTGVPVQPHYFTSGQDFNSQSALSGLKTVKTARSNTQRPPVSSISSSMKM